MPNEVYRAAVDGLADLVPPRVAKRLVDEALRATRRTPEDVSLSAMRRLLLGPIRAELEAVLPPGAAGPGLKRVAAGIAREGGRPRRRWWPLGRRQADAIGDGLEHVDEAGRERDEHGGEETPHAPAPGAAEDVAGPTTAMRPPPPRRAHDAQAAPGANLAGSPVAPSTGAAVADAVMTSAGPVSPVEAAPSPRAAAVRRRAATKAAPAALPQLDDDLVDRALRAFGALETVRHVVAVRGSEVVLGSGEGLDESALPDLALATSRLLGRDGTLKLFALERPSGALFLFPLQGGGLVVLTKPKVNVGAVLAARAALEEAA